MSETAEEVRDKAIRGQRVISEFHVRWELEVLPHLVSDMFSLLHPQVDPNWWASRALERHRLSRGD